MQEVTPPPSPPNRARRLALAACMFLITATFGFLQPFVPLYLEAAGLTRSQIGIVTGVGSGTALLIQPLLGRLSDRLDARRPLMIALALVAGLAYEAFRFAPFGTGAPFSAAVVVFTLLTALGVNGFTYLNVVGGVLVGRMVGTGAASASSGAGAYARYRVWGSVGYILVALVTGWLVSRGAGPRSGLPRNELDAVFAWGPLLFFAIAVVAFFVPDGKRAAAALTPAPSSDAAGKGAAHALRPFLLAFFLYQFALYGASAYLSLFLKMLGASPLAITTTFAAGVVCEVLVMTQVGRLTDVYGRRPALAIAFLLMPLRLLLYIPATGPWWVLAVQTLHGLNFGIMGTIAVAYVNDRATDANRGTLQARLGATQVLATAVGPVACGLIAERFGIGWMFAAMALVGALGAGVFLRRVPESHPTPTSPENKGPLLLRPVWRWLSSGGPARYGSG
jgi:MFS family permease